MTISNKLFNAILSMDSYYRGYDSGIELEKNADRTSTNIKIGNAIITKKVILM